MKTTLSNRTQNILVYILTTIAFVGTAYILYDSYRRNLVQQISELHPRVQKEIYDYAEMTEKLQPGDLVAVRNLDNLESSRYLAVTEVYGSRIRLEGRYDNHETLFLEAGLKNGMCMTSKYAFDPVYTQTDSDQAKNMPIASWFWIQ